MSKSKKIETAIEGVDSCKCAGCKKHQARFSFCDDHYEWFKFGLITKEGKKVMDFDKKLSHFEHYVEKQKTYKVA